MPKEGQQRNIGTGAQVTDCGASDLYAFCLLSPGVDPADEF